MTISRRDRRVVLRWCFAVLIMFGLAVACNVQPPADSTPALPVVVCR